jgi:hypothetical protein
VPQFIEAQQAEVLAESFEAPRGGVDDNRVDPFFVWFKKNCSVYFDDEQPNSQSELQPEPETVLELSEASSDFVFVPLGQISQAFTTSFKSQTFDLLAWQHGGFDDFLLKLKETEQAIEASQAATFVPVIELHADNVGIEMEDELAPVSVLKPVEEKTVVVETETVVEEIAPVNISESVEERTLVEYEQSDLSDLVKKESEAFSLDEDALLSLENCVGEDEDPVVQDRTYSSALVEM